MRLFKTSTQTLFFLFTSTLLLAQTTIKEKDYTLKYASNKIGIQFDDTKTATEIKAFDAFTNNEVAIEKDSATANGFNLKNIPPAQILKLQYTTTGTNSKTTTKYLASQSLSSGVMNVYFNHPINTTYAQTQNAVNLSNTLDDKLIEYINACTTTLDIAIYNSYSPSETTGIVGAINAAYTRGVQVRVIYDCSTSSVIIEVPTELNQFKDSIVNLRVKGFYNEKIRLKEVIKSKVEEYPDDMRKGFEEYKKVLKLS